MKTGWLLLVFTTFIASGQELSSSQQALDQEIKKHQGKVIYLDFWASWCKPCRKSFPWMNKLQNQFSKQDFTIISVNLDAQRKLADKFLQENPADFAVIYDPKGKIASHFQIKGMPSSVLFDRQGNIKYAHAGFFTKKIPAYEKEIRQLIEAQ